uniref:Fibronectin type-III domain-containing protein n=1 Tax=Monopterus albus TaxID=43700 RepID=A0A3Q3Q4Y2_MONAL|nr:interleukin-6 receptor subunit alpha-like [Monopterus albus]
MRKMRIFLPLLWVLCAAQVDSVYDITCPREDPTPGVLVLSSGSTLLLTCRGHVTVDGVKVNIARNSNRNKRGSFPAAPTTTGTKKPTEGHRYSPDTAVSAVTGENRRPTYTGYTASPITRVVQPTSVSRLLRGQSETEEMGVEGYYEDNMEEEEGAGGSRVTRGLESWPQWKLNGKTVGKGNRDQGELTLERRGSLLSLSSVRVEDSGNYTCHHRGRERFSVRVIVADPPEKPNLSCSKKSPSSKIRCQWTPRKPVTRPFTCYLVLDKRSFKTFIPCSYSPRFSRFWCALEYNEDEMRTPHHVYLCVRNIAGNATSEMQHFTPWHILKPDPPSGVKVQQDEECETCLTVRWNLPITWKPQDKNYNLYYELRYKPLASSYYQVKLVKNDHFHTIQDALPGVQYQIQLRNREEYDGQWSDWSTPVNASSWTDLSSTPFTIPPEGSADDCLCNETVPKPTQIMVVPSSILWISGSCVLLSVILAVFIIRHKGRLMSKLHHLNVITPCGNSSQPPPSTPAAPEGQAMVTFASSPCREPLPSTLEEEEEENEGEESPQERIEVMHFNNTCYFVFQE